MTELLKVAATILKETFGHPTKNSQISVEKNGKIEVKRTKPGSTTAA